MITSTKKPTNPEEETKMMTMVILAVIGMVIATVCMALEGKQEVTVEQAMIEQASKITEVLAQLDSLNGKAVR